MKPLVKNLLFALGLVVIVGIGYFLFAGSGDDDALVSSNTGSPTRAGVETQEFLAKLRQLQGVNIDGQLFQDQRFYSLVDYRQVIEDEPTGRQNPFAPIQ